MSVPSEYLCKIISKIENDGLGETAVYACRAGVQRAVGWPVRLRRLYDIRNRLPGRIKKMQSVLTHDREEVFQKTREATLQYIAANHLPEFGPGSYSYKTGGKPIIYASCYAALTKHLYGDLDDLSDSERRSWAGYLQRFQTQDGLFRDPAIDLPLAEEVDWWGWRHLTLHVLMALTALGAIAERPFNIIAPFRKKGYMQSWLESRNWKKDPASVSNEIQNYGVMLQYSRDFQDQEWCHDSMQELYDWLDRTQDPKTGLWGDRFNSPVLLSNGVQTGYHLWLLYFYDRRPIQYIERIIDSCLNTQNSYGGFGVQLHSSACEDIDSIDPLVRLSAVTDYRKSEIQVALKKALPWVLVNMNGDGGWVFRRFEAFQYGHPDMCVEREKSAMFPTWFRTLALAYLAQTLGSSHMPFCNCQFLKGPGLQFGLNS